MASLASPWQLAISWPMQACSSGRCCAATAASHHAFDYDHRDMPRLRASWQQYSIYGTLGHGGRLGVRTSGSTLGSYVVS
jgi:hypothetical protein